MLEAIARLNAALEGRYHVERELGEGGMATVYLADDLRHERKVALKVLKPDLAAAIGPERFLAEIRTTAKLQHPHILQLYDSGQADGLLFYVMPYVQDDSLRDRLDRHGRLPVDEAVAIASTVADALDYAHRQGVGHRDIKPANILIQDGNPVVSDFGIAIAFGPKGDTRLTVSGVSPGSPRYMSPEQIEGVEQVDGRTDVYALACVLHEMVAGTPVFNAKTTPGLAAQHLGMEPTPLRKLRREVPRWLERLVLHGLAKSPEARIPSARTFADALAAGSRRAGMRTLPQRLGIGLAVAVLAGIAIMEFRRRPPPPVQAPVHTQLTFEGEVNDGALSPDGASVAYVTQVDDRRELVVRDVEGEGRVVADSLQDLLCCVAWSPDGGRISYQRGARILGSRVITSRLGGPRRIIDADVIARWSPDGRLLVSWWPAARHLLITDVESGEVTDTVPLGEEHSFVQGVDWSPDQRRLVVGFQYPDLSSAIRVLDLNGSVQEDLVPRSGEYFMAPAWSGDGRTIYFASRSEIWQQAVSPDGRLRGSPLRVLTDAAQGALTDGLAELSPSTDGTRLAYVRELGRSDLWAFSFEETTGEARTPATRLLTGGSASEVLPRLTPDARRLTYSMRGALYLMSVSTNTPGDARRLTFSETLEDFPAWSPDGNRLAFIRQDERGRDIAVVDLSSGEETDLPIEAGAYEVEWVSDSQILFTTGDQRRVRLLEVESGSDELLLSEDLGLWWYGPRASPDGRFVAFSVSGRFIGGGWVDVQTGAMGGLGGSFHPVGWSNDGEWVYAIRSDSRLEPGREIHRVRLSDLTSELHMLLPEGQALTARQASITGDGTLLVGAVQQSSTDMWLVDGLRPPR